MKKVHENLAKELVNTEAMFMHGLCHLPAFELNKRFNLPLLVVMDIDDEMDVLVHVANILKDGKIIDMQNIYENEAEFKEFIEEDFEELTEFTFKKFRKPNNLLIEIYTDCPLNVIQRDKKAQLLLKDYIQRVSKICNKVEDKMDKEQEFNLITEMNKQFYYNHKEKIDKIFNKQDKQLVKLFIQSANSEYYSDIGAFMIYLPINHSKISAIIFSHYFCYKIENDILKQIYKYPTNTIADCNKLLQPYLNVFNIPKEFMELVGCMAIRNKLVNLTPKLVKEEIYRRTKATIKSH